MNEKFAVNVVVPASLEMGYVNQGSTVFDQEKIDKLADRLGANFEVSPIEYDGHALRGTYRKDGVTVVPKQYENAIAGRLHRAWRRWHGRGALAATVLRSRLRYVGP